MANIKASKKDIITNKRNHDRNVHFKSKMKTAVKKATGSISAQAEDAEAKTRIATKTIDKLVSKGVLHKRTAARKKSQLMKAFNASTTADPVQKADPKKKAKAAEKTAAPKKKAAKPAAKKPEKAVAAPKAKAVKKEKKAEK